MTETESPSEEVEKLSAFGYEMLAQNAAYHCRYMPNTELASPPDDPDDVPAKRHKDAQTENSTNQIAEQKLLELAAMSCESGRGFRTLFPSCGTVLTFHTACVTLSWTCDELAFRNVTNFVKFVTIVRPRIHRVNFVKSELSRVEIVEVAKAIRGDGQPENFLIDDQTFLCFKETSNDNLYATLVDELAAHVRRIEIDDEFVPHLMQAKNDFDYVKVVVSRRLEMAYLKSYFKLQTRELDIHRVASVKQVLDFDFDLFRMQPNPRIESFCVLLDPTTSSKQTDEFNSYTQRLLPNLNTLTLVLGFGLNFSADHYLDELNKQIDHLVSNYFFSTSDFLDPKIHVDFRLELSVYTSAKLREQKFDDWLTILERRYVGEKPREIRTELDSRAFVFQLQGPRPESTILIRVHPIDGDYPHDEVTLFPHDEPLLIK